MIKKAEEIFEKYNLFFLLAVAAVFLYSRWTELGEICYYMHTDELGDAYYAVSAAKYGFGSVSKMPSLYAFICAALFKIKGGLFSLKLFRLVSVAGGLFGMVFTYLSGMIMTGKKKFAFLSAVLVAALPVFYISNRAGMGAYLFLNIAPAAFYFLLKGVNGLKKVFLVISGILWGLILLTVPVSFVFVPVFVIASGAYLFAAKKIQVRDLLIFFCPVVVLYMVFAFVKGFDPGVSFANISSNFLNLKSIVWDDGHPFNVSSAFGSIYVFSVPVLIAGVVISIMQVAGALRKKEYDPEVLLWVYVIVSFVCVLISNNADIESANYVFFAAVLLTAKGLSYLSDNIKGVLIVEVAIYLICLRMLSSYYVENFNSEVNNSPDHEIGTVVDKSVGEAVKSCATVLPDKDICVITENFEGRNLLIAVYAGASPSDYESFKDEDDYSFDRIRVCSEEEFDMTGNTVYVINQYEHQDVIDAFASLGWKNIYLKEYTICYL